MDREAMPAELWEQMDTLEAILVPDLAPKIYAQLLQSLNVAADQLMESN